MINTSQAWKDNIYNAAAEKKIIFTVGNVTFGDDDIQGKVEIQETCTNGEDIKIGSCIASSLKFSLTNKTFNVDFANNEVNVQIGIKVPITGEYELVPMGIFKVDEIDKNDERVFKIVAYDRMKLFEKDCTEFLATRVYPITLFNLTLQLCSYVGIELENTTITNGDYLIEENFKASDFTSQQLLTWIGEVSASFINVNRYGKLVFKTFSRATSVITDKDYINFTVAKYSVPKITRVQVAVEEDDLGVVVGTGNVTYAIINNPLLYTKSTAQITPVINNILTTLNNISAYAPCKLYGKGNPAIETGDIITVTTVKGVVEDVVVMDRKFVYAKSFRDTYDSFGTSTVGEKRIVQSSLVQLKGKMNILSRTLEENRLKVADLEVGYNEIVQTVNELSVEVSNIEVNATYYQTDEPQTPKKGELWFNPGKNYAVDNLLMTVDEMTMTVNELVSTPSKLSRWNGTEWESIEDTELIQNVANLSIKSDEMELKVQSAEGSIGELELTATRLTSRITSAEGDVSMLEQTATTLTSRLLTAEGNISTLEQTATTLTSRLLTAEGNISTVTQTASSLTSRISTAEGNISTITQNVNSITSRISSTEGNISTLTQTSSSLTSRVASAEGNITTIKQTTDNITLAVNASKVIFGSNGLTIDNGGFFIKNGSTTLLSSTGGNIQITGNFTTGYATFNGNGLWLSPYVYNWNGSPSGGRLYFDTNDNALTMAALGWRNVIETSQLRYEQRQYYSGYAHIFTGGDVRITGNLYVNDVKIK